MTTIEKYLFGAIGVAALMFFGSFLFEPVYRAVAMGITGTLVLSLMVYYIYQIGWSFYSLVLLLMYGGIMGAMFKIQHWPGAGPIDLLGFATLFLFAFWMIWYGIKHKVKSVSFFATAVLLICQCVFSMAYNTELWEFRSMLPYPLIGTIATLKFYQLETDKGMDKILNIILIQSLLSIGGETASKWLT